MKIIDNLFWIMMRETHELLDSIERKVQNCIGEGDSYEKLLFSQRR